MAVDSNPQGTVANTPARISGSLEEVEDRILDDILGDSEGSAEEDVEEPRRPKRDAGDEPDEGDDADEPDDTADDDESVDDEADDQPRDEKGRFASDGLKVRLENGDVVTVADLKRSPLLQADYTRKTQEVAEQRRNYEHGTRRVEQLESELSNEREWTASVLAYLTPKAPDRSEIANDPIGYQERMAAWQEAQQYMQSLQQQHAIAQQRRQQMSAEQMQEQAKEGRNRLLEAVPELRDDAKFRAFADDVLRHGTEHYGFTRDELGGVTDPRMLRTLHDAIKWRRLQAQKPKAQDKAKGRPPVSPGRRQEPETNRARSREKDFKTLAATGGKGKDGDAALDRLLDKFI